jgi:uncharacterized protein (TIGR03083 family)
VKLTPRYGAPCIELVCDTDELRAATLRQRRRAVDTFGRLDIGQWQAQSRCDEWKVRDVVAHLVDTDGFWTASIQAGLGGEPTRILQGFDPARTPALLAAAQAESAISDLHASYASAVETFCSVVEGLDAEGWRALAEAPPGHVGVDAVVHHALWDSWVHERDVLVPLGLEHQVEEDEVLAVLAYAAGLGPSFDLQPDRQGTLVVEVVDAGAEIVVEVGPSVRVSRGPLGRTTSATARLTGDAVDLAETFSIRRPFDVELGDGAWMVAGLATTFDQAIDSTPAR